jgi:protein associated with RNAse G/E
MSFWDYRRNARFEAPDGLLEIYFRHKWYNVWHIAEQVSNINRMYVNIAMPATIRDDVIVWTDLDLDYRVHPDYSVERLDEEEFEQNALRFRYPLDVMAQVKAACAEVEAGLERGGFPFDHARQVELYHRIKSETSRSRAR